MKARVIRPYQEADFSEVLDYQPEKYIVVKDNDGVNRLIDLKTTQMELRHDA
jgi:hypothetical protein